MLETLKHQHYFQVAFPLPRQTLENAIHAFFKFLEEPEDIKNHINFSIAPLHRRGDIGFKRREVGDNNYNDNKDFFHFHPEILTSHEEFIQGNAALSDFMQQAKPIWDLTYKTVRDILTSFEPSFPQLTARVFCQEPYHVVLRFLRYSWQESGKYLAKPHFDAGAFTLAIAESSPGLRIGSCPENLQLIEHKEQHAIFMLSSNFQKVMPTQDYSPGWHDVIQLDETLIGRPYARWAIVAFIDAYGVEAVSRNETHKWYVDQVA